MSTDSKPITVVFKRFPEGDIIAIFPEEHEPSGMLLSYQHSGQHTPCSPELLTELPDAFGDEYEPLYNELEGLGYNLYCKHRERYRSVMSEVAYPYPLICEQREC